MEIGLGLPPSVPLLKGETVLEWAIWADGGPFSSLAIPGRLSQPKADPVVPLVAVAGATVRIRLIATIMAEPLQNPAVLGNQAAASLDALSGARLTLGLVIGTGGDENRTDLVHTCGRSIHFDRQLAAVKRILYGEPPIDEGALSPPSVAKGYPEFLIGAGAVPKAIGRVSHWADGFITAAGTGDTVSARQAYRDVEAAWVAAGRPGRPRFVGGMYFALGPNASNMAASHLDRYYAPFGLVGDHLAKTIPSTDQGVRAAVQAFTDIGMDELVLWPCIPELNQPERLAQLVG